MQTFKYYPTVDNLKNAKIESNHEHLHHQATSIPPYQQAEDCTKFMTLAHQNYYRPLAIDNLCVTPTTTESLARKIPRSECSRPQEQYNPTVHWNAKRYHFEVHYYSTEIRSKHLL